MNNDIGQWRSDIRMKSGNRFMISAGDIGKFDIIVRYREDAREKNRVLKIKWKCCYAISHFVLGLISVNLDVISTRRCVDKYKISNERCIDILGISSVTKFSLPT